MSIIRCHTMNYPARCHFYYNCILVGVFLITITISGCSDPARKIEKYIEEGDVLTLSSVLEKNPSISKNKTYTQQPLLNYAVSYNLNTKEIVRLLIKHGADVNEKNESNETPLHDAAFH